LSVRDDKERTFGSVAYAADGTVFATGAGNFDRPKTDIGLVTVWDAASHKARFELKGHTEAVESVAFSPDSEILVSAGGKYRDDALIFWSVNTGREIKRVDVTKWWSGSRIIRFGKMVFSPDGKYLAVPVGSWNRGGQWGELRLWNCDLESLEPTVLLRGHGKPVTSAAFSSNEKMLMAGTADGMLKVWNLTRD
jgi:WD40 repeat protein